MATNIITSNNKALRSVKTSNSKLSASKNYQTETKKPVYSYFYYLLGNFSARTLRKGVCN